MSVENYIQLRKLLGFKISFAVTQSDLEKKKSRRQITRHIFIFSRQIQERVFLLYHKVMYIRNNDKARAPPSRLYPVGYFILVYYLCMQMLLIVHVYWFTFYLDWLLCTIKSVLTLTGHMDRFSPWWSIPNSIPNNISNNIPISLFSSSNWPIHLTAGHPLILFPSSLPTLGLHMCSK